MGGGEADLACRSRMRDCSVDFFLLEKGDLLRLAASKGSTSSCTKIVGIGGRSRGGLRFCDDAAESAGWTPGGGTADTRAGRFLLSKEAALVWTVETEGAMPLSRLVSLRSRSEFEFEFDLELEGGIEFASKKARGE